MDSGHLEGGAGRCGRTRDGALQGVSEQKAERRSETDRLELAGDCARGECELHDVHGPGGERLDERAKRLKETMTRESRRLARVELTSSILHRKSARIHESCLEPNVQSIALSPSEPRIDPRAHPCAQQLTRTVHRLSPPPSLPSQESPHGCLLDGSLHPILQCAPSHRPQHVIQSDERPNGSYGTDSRFLARSRSSTRPLGA